MSYENIRFSKENMATFGGYFYMFDEETDTLVQKTDDGSTSFSYSLDSILEKEIIDSEWDGVNFWTLEKDDPIDDLEDPDNGNVVNMTIKRWQISNYICKLQQTINLNRGAGHKYESNAFTVEHYHTTVTGTYHAPGATTILVGSGYGTKIASGMEVTLGPNSSGESETIEVQDAGEGYIDLQSATEYAYNVDDEVKFYNYVWLFNNYDGEDDTTGALYKINAYNGAYINKYSGGAYKDILAATFDKIDIFSEYGEIDTLIYAKASNILFVDISSADPSLPYYGSMVVDNVNLSSNEIIDIYDLAIDNNNMFKLQEKAIYYGSLETYSTYNYQIAPMDSFVTSISLSATPAVITANEVSTSTIVASVLDQFNQPVQGRLVSFFDDDGVGNIQVPTVVNTDSNGKAQVVYKAGSEARGVKITATINQ